MGSGGDNGHFPNLFREAHDMTVLACATHFLGRMRLVAREVVKEDGSGGDDSSKAFPAEVAAAVLSTPITPREIANAIDARGEGAVPFLDGEADFGRSKWADVNKTMLGAKGNDNKNDNAGLTRWASLRDGLMENPASPAQTWEIVRYSDERSEKELVYAIAVDDAKRRVVVSFRASVTLEDWKHNFNWFFGAETNPIADPKEGGVKQSKKIYMHRGFRNYLYQKEEGEEEAGGEEDDKALTKIHSILRAAAEITRDRPGYDLYTTGYSLGAGLATIFALYAAASDDLPKPVTCVTIGSPKCGTMSFRKAFAALEASGKLRYLRIANDNDAIKEAPFRRMSDKAPLVPGPEYRHVGMALSLRQAGGFSFSYPRLTRSYWRLVWDDSARQELVCRNCCIVCCSHLRGKAAASEIGDHHGYAEYMHRLETNREFLEAFDLDGLYRKARKGMVPFLCCPLLCGQPEYSEGEMTLHYY